MKKLNLNDFKTLIKDNINSIENRIKNYLLENYESNYMESLKDDILYDVKVTDVLNCSIDLDSLSLTGDNEVTFKCKVDVSIIFIPSDINDRYYYFDEEEIEFDEGTTYFDENITFEIDHDTNGKIKYRIYN